MKNVAKLLPHQVYIYTCIPHQRIEKEKEIDEK